MPKSQGKRISSRPPAPKAPDLEDKMEAFILGEENDPGDRPRDSEAVRPQEETQPESLPWEAEHVRDDVIKSINLRLPEPYILKLKYLSEQTNISQQKLIRDILCPVLDQRIDEIN